MDDKLIAALEAFARGNGRLLVLTGEGVAEESGIRPFRADPQPFDVQGAVFTTRELLTRQLFDTAPQVVWAWHLMRLELARQAEPGPAHLAVARIAERLGARMTLVTECVDGLHRRTLPRQPGFFEPQGNLFVMRCAAECTLTHYPVPKGLYGWTAARAWTDKDRQQLCCPSCGGPTRPHILWRDEIYDEANYRLNSILNAARQTDLLIVAGFAGHTNLANKVAWEVSHNHRAVIVDINPALNPVAALARRIGGFAVQASPAEILPVVLDAIKG